VSSFTITDFKWGMDRRRSRAAGVPGTLWLGKNVQISRGGDVERVKKLVPTFDLPENTFGLSQVRGQLFVFGSVAEPDGIPVGVQYQRLQAADTSATMTEVLDVRTFDGAFYVIARYSNGQVHHFYDGARVTDWDTIADANTDVNTLANHLADLIDVDENVMATALGNVITITARTAGTAFSISKETVDLGGISDQDITLETIQANVSAVAEVQATTTVTVLSGATGIVADITINGVSLMRAAVPWATSNTATAAAIAVQINNKTATHGYSAVAAGAAITITAAVGTGDTPNEYAVAQVVTGDVLLDTPSMSGGVDEVEAVAQSVTATLIGTMEPEDLYTITINSTAYKATGRAAAMGVSAFVHKNRVWSPANSLQNYCKLNDASDWTDSNVSSGAGFVNVANQSEGADRLIGSAPYGTQAAFFSRNNTYIFALSADAEDIAFVQPLDNTGALAARAIIPFGNLDVFYPDENGIRSLRAHSTTGQANVSDPGSPIDSFFREHLDTLSEAEIRRGVSIIGPEGRLWMAVGGKIFLFSSFPGSKISAWSYIDFTASDFARVRNKLYVRSGNTIYLYGGTNGTTYPDDDERSDEVSTAFMTAQNPALVKSLTGFDIACSGQWAGYILVDPNDDTKQIAVGNLDKTTYNLNGNIKIPDETTHVAFRFVCTKGGAATISNITVHYDPVEAG
jgi:hypothetical protein